MPLKVKADSFVVETTIHFPTDFSLLWDSSRKVLDTISLLYTKLVLVGWRQAKSQLKKLKKTYRKCAEIHRKKGQNYWPRLKKATKAYLEVCQTLVLKVEETLKVLSKETLSPILAIIVERLRKYNLLVAKHVGLVYRRIILEEKIPHGEKLFSIFEQHTEWISKGKEHKKVELGRNVCIVTDQYQFIVHHCVMEKEVDKQITTKIGAKIVELYPAIQYSHDSISFDRGFYSALAKKELNKMYKLVILPKPGKKSIVVQEEENSPVFVKACKKHSAVEAHINQVEHNGLDKCPDKGERSFKRYVALGVLSYNLKRFGHLLLTTQQEKAKKKRKKVA